MHITHSHTSISLSREVFSDFDRSLKRHKPSKVFFLVDENTHEHCLPKVLPHLSNLEDFEILEIEPGEQSKCHEVLVNLYHALLELNADRKCLVVNIGGGVVTDLGGFMAATYKRGVSFVNFPTSLLAMVDASSGGKTGIDLGEYKNMIGTFTSPVHTYVYPSFLKTLPKDHLLSGFAEMLKHGLIADAGYFKELSNLDMPEGVVSDEFIWASVKIKDAIVEKDFRENGLRKTLNFGHTLGHALESAWLQQGKPILHGEAVAVGMLGEAFLSQEQGLLSEEAFQEVEQVITKFYGKPEVPFEASHLMPFLLQDKKNDGGIINFTLLKSIGSAQINVSLGEEEISGAWKYLSSL